mmetsp:Transcript_8478/g.12962  ORF Transcript_8478/g.12962 Transcript_8478/m.12962 type:complete len:292 (-) Transcript_8478:213-1088(-)
MEFTDHSIFGIFVDPGLVLNILGSARVPQRRDSLLAVVVGRSAVSNHDGLRVSSEGVLQDTRQLRVTIRNVRALRIDQRTNHVAQRRQRQVNLGGLLQTVAGGSGLALTLTSSQIDDVELTHLDMGFAVVLHLRTLHSDREDGVAAGGVFVHVSAANMAIEVAFLEHIHQVLGGFHDEGAEVLHIDTGVLVLELELLLAVLEEQVSDFFVVDLEVGGSHQVLLGAVALNLLENGLEGSGHDTLQLLVLGHSVNGKGLSRSGLPVGEDGAVVTLKHVVDDRVGRLQEDLLLF